MCDKQMEKKNENNQKRDISKDAKAREKKYNDIEWNEKHGENEAK